MVIIILAGGFGKRLQFISQGIPKALLPIGNKVFLDKIFGNIFKLNIDHIYLSLYYKPELFEAYLRSSSYSNRIKPIIEPKPLGTGGAIKYVVESTSISSPFFAINGDTLSNLNLGKMKIAFDESGYDIMVGVSYINNASRYGTVKFEGDRLIDFIEKGSALSGWINNGHYIMNKDVLNDISVGEFSIEFDVFPKLTSDGRIGVFPVIDDDFIDIGIPEDYQRLLKRNKQ
ncbi:MAG: NTP transferase domain-containing protein [Candidatus Marinimicrobia bacterium]|nr:NTP transferase domain-containing protein [Candidatus Neomarinimicrobiota bacterium]